VQQVPESFPADSTEFGSFSSFSAAAHEPLLDVASAIDRLGGSVEVFRDVTSAFLKHLPDAAAALAATHDPHERLALVHELGSSLGTVGAMRAHFVARAMEARWRHGDLHDAARCTALLGTLLDLSAQALTATLRAGS
jgi:hypothetical protein